MKRPCRRLAAPFRGRVSGSGSAAATVAAIVTGVGAFALALVSILKRFHA